MFTFRRTLMLTFVAVFFIKRPMCKMRYLIIIVSKIKNRSTIILIF